MVKLKRLWGLLAMIMVAMLSISVVSCGDDDGYGSGSQIENNGNSSTMDAIYENQLSGTSWKQSSCAIYYSDGSVGTDVSNAIVTFANNHIWYIIGINGKNGWGTWKVENGKIKWETTGNNAGYSNVSFRAIVVANNFGPNTIASLTDSKMRLVYPDDGWWVEYTRVSYQEPSDTGGGGS